MTTKHKTHTVKIGPIAMGGDQPVLVQSMTNTDTADAKATADQVIELFNSGSEMVRITVNTPEAASKVAEIRQRIQAEGLTIPLVGDFHYNGHRLLTEYPDCAKALDKYRVNPGNVGFGKKQDEQFSQIIGCAIRYDKPVRIGVNWGSLDQQVLAKMLDENNQRKNPLTLEEVTREALVSSAIASAEYAEKCGLGADRIVVSCKVSEVNQLVAVYQMLAERSDYALHLGLTEAGMGMKGIVATSSALAVLLNQGIGNTIRASLTPRPGGDRTEEVQLCQELLQALGLRAFAPAVTACPGCGRTTSTFFQQLAEDIQNFIKKNMPRWRTSCPGVEDLKLAVMGCVVNGPGESKHADIGISLPGTGEAPKAPVFIDGQKAMTLSGDNIAQQFLDVVEEYIEQRWGNT